MADRTDASLMMQIAHWGAFMNLEEALQVIWSDDFDPDAATVEDSNVNRILTWGETIGTLTKNGLLDTDLVLDWLWVSGIWGRVGPAGLKARHRHGVPELYENFEALAAKQT